MAENKALPSFLHSENRSVEHIVTIQNLSFGEYGLELYALPNRSTAPCNKAGNPILLLYSFAKIQNRRS